jgi:hypothetical protein
VATCGAAGRLDEAAPVLEDMLREDITLGTTLDYTVTMTACVKGGAWPQVRQERRLPLEV